MRHLTKRLLALPITIASSVLGAVYYAYLVAVPFPPDTVRIIPVLWLIVALAGLSFGIALTFSEKDRLRGVATVVLSVPNIFFAAIFALGALMGD